jgi:hypothetical protein
MSHRVLLVATLGLLAAGCAVTPPEPYDFSAFQAAAPRSILVVPAVNESLDVDAPNYLLTTLARPLAEKGYYVFPVHTTKFVLEQEGFYEGEQIHNQPPELLAQLFDADAVLFVTINRWDAQYAVLSTSVTVQFTYRMVARDGTEIWQAEQGMVYTPQSNSSGNPLADLIAAAVSAAVTRAAPNYMPLARQANQQVLILGHTAIPDGPYRQEAGGR